MSSRLVWRMTSALRSASDDGPDDAVQVLLGPAAQQPFDVDFHDPRGAVLFDEGLELPGGDADVRPDDDQAAGVGGREARVRFLAAEFGADFLADAAPDERRTHPVEQLLAPAFGFLQAQGQCAEIVFGHDVGDDRGGIRGRVDGVRDGFGRGLGVPVRAGGTDDVQVQHDHRIRREPASGLLLHVLRQFGIREAEARVPGEFGLGHRSELAGVPAGAAHVVHAADRHASGVGERGDDHDAVRHLAVTAATVAAMVSGSSG